MSAYDTQPWTGVRVVEVRPGTKISDPRHPDRTETVDDDHGVMRGRVMFVTAKVYRALRKATRER